MRERRKGDDVTMAVKPAEPCFNQTDRYAALIDVVRERKTSRAFAPYTMPRGHFEL